MSEAVQTGEIAEIVVRADLSDTLRAPTREFVMPDVHARFDGAPRWIVTFADLVALLVAFFVMILSMSTFEPDAAARLSGASASARGVAQMVPARATGEALAREADKASGKGARYVASLLLGQLAELGLDDGVTMTSDDAGVLLVLPSALLADNATGADFRALLGRAVASAPGRITLFGAAEIGDAASLYEAAPERLRAYDVLGIATDPQLGAGVGAAGWLKRGQIAIAIRNPRRAPNVTAARRVQ